MALIYDPQRGFIDDSDLADFGGTPQFPPLPTTPIDDGGIVASPIDPSVGVVEPPPPLPTPGSRARETGGGDARVAPPGPTGPTGGGGGTGPTFPPSNTGSFSWPGITLPPPFHTGPYAPPQPFSFPQFRAPSLEDARNEPGYAFARDEGQRALQTGQAAKGILRTGGSLKDLLAWGDKFAEQNYGNVFNRAKDTYSTNFATAFEPYKANAQIGLDAYTTNYRGAKDAYQSQFDTGKTTFDAQQRQAEQTLADLLARYKSQLDFLRPVG